MELKKWHNIENQVKGIIARVANIDPQSVTLNARIVEDLGVDSLDIIEIIMNVEEALGIEVSDEQAEQMSTVSDAFEQFVAFMPDDVRDQIDSSVIAFRVREDGNIQVGMQTTDGKWTFADGTAVLPSGIYVTVFSKWGNVLKELEDLINSPGIKERTFQEFFEEYPDLLQGDEYDIVVPQARIVPDERLLHQHPWRADFILSPIDQSAFCKVLEIKVPTVEVIGRVVGGHQRYYSALWAAIDQLRDYGEAFNDAGTRTRFQEMYGLDVYKPDLHLVAGRKWNMRFSQSILELQRREHITLSDWDTHLEYLRRKFT